MAAVLNRVSIVTGNPNSPLRAGMKQVFTCNYNSGSAGDTITVGPIKANDIVRVLNQATNAAAGFAGICENYSARTNSLTSGTVSLVPIGSVAPNANYPLTIIVERL